MVQQLEKNVIQLAISLSILFQLCHRNVMLLMVDIFTGNTL